KFTLNNRVILLLVSLVFFAGTFAMVKIIPKEFVPAQDTSNFMMRIKAPDGSSLEYTDRLTREVEKFLLDRKEIKRYFVAVGGFGGSMEANSANLFVTLHDPKDRPKDPEKGRPLKQIELLNVYRQAFKDFKGAKVMFQDTSQGGFSAS